MATETLRPTATRPLTYVDILETPVGESNRYEIIAGEMFVSASPSKRHAWISTRLFRWIADYAEQNNLGVVFHAPVDVRLTLHDVVVPDVIFLREERKHLFGEHFVDGPPDLIVEILSPSTRSRDVTAKKRLYAETGVQEYWVVDQVTADVTVYWRSHKGSYEVISAEDGKVRSRIIPGLEIISDKLLVGLD